MAPYNHTTAYFGLGLSIGLVIAFTLTTYSSLRFTVPKIVYHSSYDAEVTSDGDKTKILNIEDSNRALQTIPSQKEINKLGGLETEFHFNDAHAHHDDSTVADELYRKVRVLCWVMTSPQNLQKKTIHVRATWAKRCNKLLFMSSVTNSSFPTIGLNISEGREHLTAKTMRAYDYIADNHMDDADWFMKADDDTYVILENLRYFLSDVDTNEPVFYGHLFNTIVKQGYFSGGAGYVLSKEALRRLRARDVKQCRSDGGMEDVEIGRCMESLGVKTGKTVDSLGRSRFHCFDPERHLRGEYPDWYYTYDANGAKAGLDSISDYAITFHYVPPERMYSLEFYVYHLRPYGLISSSQSLNVLANGKS